MKIDLHMHTSASDGTWSPEALIQNVINAGIEIFSVTDHDTVENIAAVSDLAIGRECLLYYTPLPSVGWSLGIVFPQDEFMADVYHLGGTIAFLGLSGFVVIL